MIFRIRFLHARKDPCLNQRLLAEVNGLKLLISSLFQLKDVSAKLVDGTYLVILREAPSWVEGTRGWASK
jgi:hypothetical protein